MYIDDNDDYLDEEYFFEKWKNESDNYYNNLDNINNEYNK